MTLPVRKFADQFPHTSVDSSCSYRSGGLRSSTPLIIPTDRRIFGLFQRNIPSFLRERQRKMVPGGASPLSRCSMPHSGNANRFKGRCSGDREVGQTKTETGYERAGRKTCKGTRRRQVCRVLSIDAKGFEERLRRGECFELSCFFRVSVLSRNLLRLSWLRSNHPLLRRGTSVSLLDGIIMIRRYVSHFSLRSVPRRDFAYISASRIPLSSLICFLS